VAVPVDGTGTVSVAPVMAPPVPGVQKPPRRVGKQFRDRLLVAPEKEKVKRPAGLRTRPTWLRQRGLPGVASAAMQALRRLTATTLSRDPTLMVKKRGPRRRTPWGRRRVAEGVEPGRPDGPRRGGWRAARLAARWAARC
jgi:hypothetical protein